MSSNKNPPLLSKSSLYSDWKKKVNIWSSFTTLEKKKHGAAVLLTLDGSAEEAVLELELEIINSDDGLEKVLEKLDKLYLKDTTLEKFEALDKFDTYKRTSETSIQEHIHQFEKLYFKLKSHGTTISEDLLAYKLLKSANLSKQDEKLAKGTVTELTLISMKAQLKKIFPDKESLSQASNSLQVHEINEVTYENIDNDGCYPTYFAGRHSNQDYQRYAQRRTQTNQQPMKRYSSVPSSKNPPSRTGQISRCRICESIYHWAADCPDKKHQNDNQRSMRPRNQPLPHRYVYFQEQEDDPSLYQVEEHDTYHKIILFQSDYDHPKHLPGLVAESWNAAVLDSGATKTVCGRSWYNTFIESLSETDVKKVKTSPVSNVYRFGDGNEVTSTQTATIPAFLGLREIGISTDIVEKDIPLLLSREAMKKANMSIDFKDDTASVFNTVVNLNVTKSGHYTVPLTRQTQLLSMVDTKCEPNIVLSVQEATSKHNQALKIHRQFAHAPVHKLIKLVKSAGDPWAHDKELEQELHAVAKNCQTCQQYGRAALRPVVGLPSANKFLDTVAMDLKFYRQKILLHMIDHATRLSACVRIPSKRPEHIIKGIFSNWISVYGTTDKFLSDNGGEFINESFLEMCEQMNIKVRTTGAESPWSNGLVERHNQIISAMLDKVLEDTDCDFDIALSWCANAKNSLTNCHGFSPYQLAIGGNPRLPSAMNNELPALTADIPTSDILRQNLNGLHAAREAFMHHERSERLRRALSSNTRTYSDVVILTGDIVYYKRNNETKWRGPATVLGKDGQQTLLKHGGYYIRVHPCRIRPARNPPVRNNDSTICDQDDSNHISSEKDAVTSGSPSTPEKQSQALEDDSDSDEQPHHVSITPPTIAPTPPPTPRATAPRSRNTHRPHRYMSSAATNTRTLDTDFEQQQSLDVQQASSDNQKCPDVNSLRKNDTVEYQLKNDDTCKKGSLHSRSGKSTGKWKYSWNVKSPEGEFQSVDFSSDVITWHHTNKSNNDQEVLQSEILIAQVDTDIELAKQRELQSWKSQKVYEEVTDEGQNFMNVRWVITPKVIDNKPSTKARLVGKGFQEFQDYRTDSPTCSRESVRLCLSITASMKWTLHSLDIKTAFLQGYAIERTVFIKPPKEANTEKLWKLMKCVYGLADAPRQFYLRLRQELIKLGVTPSPFDNGLFYWRVGDALHGILVCHVDDIMWSGTKNLSYTGYPAIGTSIEV